MNTSENAPDLLQLTRAFAQAALAQQGTRLEYPGFYAYLKTEPRRILLISKEQRNEDDLIYQAEKIAELLLWPSPPTATQVKDKTGYVIQEHADSLPPMTLLIVSAAREGRLKKGVQSVPSGIILNPAEYVLEWIKNWPRDRNNMERHILECAHLLE